MFTINEINPYIKMSKIWPFNLTMDIMKDYTFKVNGDELFPAKIYKSIFNIDIDNLYSVLNEFEDQDQMIVKLRYIDKLSIHKISNQIGRSDTYVKNHINKIINKLSHPSRRMKIFHVSNDSYNKLSDVKLEQDKRIKSLEREIDDLNLVKEYLNSHKNISHIFKYPKHLDIDRIEISTAMRNALKRFDIYNLKELSWMTKNDIMRIKGIGDKKFNEIKCLLNKYGLSILEKEDITDDSLYYLDMDKTLRFILYYCGIFTIPELKNNIYNLLCDESLENYRERIKEFYDDLISKNY